MMTESGKVNITISCAADPGPNESSRDCYGFRHKDNIILYRNGISSVTDETCEPLLACIADGETVIRIPDNPEKDAGTVSVKHFLNEEYENYFDDELKYHAADAVNDSVIRQAELLGYDLSASFAALGIKGNTVRIMYFGNCCILHIHEGKLKRYTPLKMSNFISTYVGNDTLRGSEMAVFNDYPLCKGDTWILATDGVSEPLTDIDHNLYDDLIMRIVNNNPVNPAEVLVKVSGETYYPFYTTDLCKDNRTAVIIHIREN
jgi:hypothetical protein